MKKSSSTMYEGDELYDEGGAYHLCFLVVSSTVDQIFPRRAKLL